MNSKEWFDAQHESFADDPEYVAEGLALDVVVELGRAMRAQGLTQKELAERIGASPAFVSQTLHGKPNMTMLTLAKFALALNLECSIKLSPHKASEKYVPVDKPQATLVVRKPDDTPPGTNRSAATGAFRRPSGGTWHPVLVGGPHVDDFPAAAS